MLLDVQGALTIDQDSKVANTQTTVDKGGTLTVNTATFTGGVVTINGTLDQTGSAVLTSGTLANNGSVVVTGTGNAWDDENVTANVLLDVQGALTVDQGSKVANTQTTVDKGGTLTLDTATFTGGAVTINGALISTGTSFITGATINNTNNLEVAGGTLTIDPATVTNTGTILVTNNSTLVLNGETVFNSVTDPVTKVTTNGTIQVDAVDATHFSTLALQSSAIDGGLLTISGLLQSTGTSFVTGVSFTNTGATDVVNGTLTLNSTTVSGGGSVTVESGSVLDLIDAILIGGTLSGPGQITTDATNTETTFDGVTVNAGTTVTASAGILDLTGTITNNGEFDATTGAIDFLNANFTGGKLGGSGTITTDAANTETTLNGVTLNSGSKVTASAGILDLTGTITNNGEFDATTGAIDFLNANFTGGKLGGSGTITTDAANTKTTLSGVTLNSGSKVTASAGILDLTGTITNNGEFDATTGALDFLNANFTGGKLGGSGTITTDAANTKTTLSGVTVNAGTTVTSTAGVLDLTGTITNNGEFDATTGALDFLNANITGGKLGGTGTITTDAANTATTLNGVTLKSGSKVTASAGVLNLTGSITATGAEIDANNGAAVDLVSLILLGGTLGGLGTIATASALNTFNGVTIASCTTVTVTDNTALDLKGTIDDAGTIALNSSGDSTQIEVSGSVLLNGSGLVSLSDNTHNAIVSDGSAATLDNFDTITGAGTIGDANLTLSNSGVIEATGSHALVIDTGTNTSTAAGLVGSLLVTNNAGGVLEAAPGHTLQIDDNVLNHGTIVADSSGGTSISAVDITGNVENDGIIQAGSTTSHSASSVGVTASIDISGNVTGTGSIELYDNATVEIGGTVSKGQAVIFENAGGGSLLILDDSHGFQGTIYGLTEYSTENLENHVDLKDLAYVRGQMSTHYSNGVLTISDGHGPGSDSVSLNVAPSANMDPAFEFAMDKTGGTLIDDPSPSGPMTIDSGQTLDISGAGTGTVTFTSSNGNTGELVLGDSHEFTGVITGFTGDGTLANSDLIDLQDINFANLTTETYTENANGTGGTLTVSDGTNTTSLNFSGNYTLANFDFSSDGNGGTLLVDPPTDNGGTSTTSSGQFVFDLASSMQINLPSAAQPVAITNTTAVFTPSSSVSDTQTADGAMDQFVFAPTTGTTPAQHTIINFNPNLDTINLQQFGKTVISAADLIANHTSQVGNDTLITVDSSDSILLKNVHAANLHTSDFLVHA